MPRSLLAVYWIRVTYEQAHLCEVVTKLLAARGGIAGKKNGERKSLFLARRRLRRQNFSRARPLGGARGAAPPLFLDQTETRPPPPPSLMVLMNLISLHARPIRSTTQNWVVTRDHYGISALVPQTSFRGETISLLLLFLKGVSFRHWCCK